MLSCSWNLNPALFFVVYYHKSDQELGSFVGGNRRYITTRPCDGMRGSNHTYGHVARLGGEALDPSSKSHPQSIPKAKASSTIGDIDAQLTITCIFRTG